jgi:hypothetical protein
MVIEQEVAEITRESSSDLRLDSVIVRNSGGINICLERPHSIKILERFQEGRFNNSQYNVRQGTEMDNGIGDNDVLTIETVVYKGIRRHVEEFETRPETYVEDLTFGEYVQLGRRETIHVVESKRLTS